MTKTTAPTIREQLEQVREKLREATETIEAIRNGEVDALVVAGPQGNQIYSLAGAEHPYRIYVEQMQEGAVTLSADGTILYANLCFANMLQIPLERVIGSSLSDHIPDEDKPVVQALLKCVPQPSARAEVGLKNSGGVLPVAISVSFMPTQGGDAVICLVVSDRTLQIERTNLRIAKEAAEAANVAKDNFLAALSHELRTPLTPALFTAAHIENNPDLPQNLREDVALIRRNIELEARLIDDLLDLTRLTRGKLDLRPRIIDLHSALENALAICWPDAETKGVQLTHQWGTKPYEVNVDPVRLQQAIWNLVRNAIKFTPPGGRVLVRTGQKDSSAVVEVIDTGVGIPAHSLPRIFNAFEQGDRSVTREFGGLGLGLAITKAIVSLHGGQVSAESAGAGHGSTFTLTLPLASAGQSVQGDPLSTAFSAPRSLHILLVEDHPDTRNSMAMLLKRRFGHKVTTATNAAEALSTAASHAFDLVISDLGLPDASGQVLMGQLKLLYKLKGICLSGYGMEDDVRKAHDAGFEHHLTKPVDIDKLESLIRQVGE
jgi:PAS domain S-box-containing protein